MTTSTRPLYWSIRRELWENRSIIVAPLIVASVALFSFFVSSFRLPSRMRTIDTLAATRQHFLIVTPYDMVASMIILTGFVVGVFYCLDALNGERRDRSILFWKSMPVSDRLTVFSKAGIPLVVQPLLSFVLALFAQCLMLMWSTIVLAGAGMSPVSLWSRVPIAQLTFVMFYGLLVHTLWYAPIFAYLLLISAWAKRAMILWAVLPFFVVGAIEHIVFHTSAVADLLKYRFAGAMTEAFRVNAATQPVNSAGDLAPINFLCTPGLWLGLIFAAACLAGAIRLRRDREPM